MTPGQIAIVILAVGIGWAVLQIRHTRRKPQGGWLYFIGNGRGPIKVGITREDTPEERMRDLQTGNPTRLQVLYAIYTEDPESAEGIAHNALGEHHVGGEWYGREAALELMEALKYSPKDVDGTKVYQMEDFR